MLYNMLTITTLLLLHGHKRCDNSALVTWSQALTSVNYIITIVSLTLFCQRVCITSVPVAPLHNHKRSLCSILSSQALTSLSYIITTDSLTLLCRRVYDHKRPLCSITSSQAFTLLYKFAKLLVEGVPTNPM